MVKLHPLIVVPGNFACTKISLSLAFLETVRYHSQMAKRTSWGGVFVFRVVVGDMYPHYAPYVKCLTKVCHPYIDSDGNVYLNILHTDWSPVITISQVVDGIYRLFTATFTSDETTMIDLTMDDYDASSSGEKMHLPTTPTNLNVKRTYVYVCSMDNIYPSKRRRISDNE
ncbi:hypothetical protein LXL04_035330 [Taraxacum kok-saghyz]